MLKQLLILTSFLVFTTFITARLPVHIYFRVNMEGTRYFMLKQLDRVFKSDVGKKELDIKLFTSSFSKTPRGKAQRCASQEYSEKYSRHFTMFVIRSYKHSESKDMYDMMRSAFDCGLKWSPLADCIEKEEIMWPNPLEAAEALKRRKEQEKACDDNKDKARKKPTKKELEVIDEYGLPIVYIDGDFSLTYLTKFRDSVCEKITHKEKLEGCNDTNIIPTDFEIANATHYLKLTEAMIKKLSSEICVFSSKDIEKAVEDAT